MGAALLLGPLLFATGSCSVRGLSLLYRKFGIRWTGKYAS
jgi:hypothetical protein